MCCPCLHAQAPDKPAPAAPVKTSITVVEKVTAETPGTVTLLNSKQIQETPGLDLDDRLRQVPGFSLFKRSSSVVAHPTTQGISLRGLGSSGASRSLVLWDGIPMNDPFGGWVYWTQFPPDELDDIEISPGASTSVFGDRAMSGVVALFSRPPQQRHLSTYLESGSQNTQDFGVGFSDLWSRFAVSGFARAFTTDGYYIVPETFDGKPLRGAADTRAGVRFVTGNVHLDRYTSFGNFYVEAIVLAEDRKNGTLVSHNSTGLGTIAMHFERQLAADDSISILGFHTREDFHSTFDFVTHNRNTDRLTYFQTVPSDALGGSALWRHHRMKWDLLAGADVNRVGGTDTDHLFPFGERIGGGVLLEHGLFAQGNMSAGPVRFFAGLRHTFTGTAAGTFLSPSAGITTGFKRVRLRGSVFRAFRAPTLNELYREFSVGNTVTLANPALGPETVFGAETGFDWSFMENGALHFTAFRNSVDNLITNVTLSSTGNSILRQRQNAAAVLSRGLEAGYQQRFGRWTVDLGYLFADTRYVTGLRVPEVPKNQGTGEISYQHGGTLTSAGVRSFGSQFDDDLNHFLLPGFTVAEVMLRQHLVASLSAEVAIDNLLDRTFYTAFTPTPNIGNPRLWRVGLRWDGKLW